MQQEGYDFMAPAFEVYNELGSGFTEDVYHEALTRELTARGIPCQSHVELSVQYKGQPLTRKFKPDLIVFNNLIIELKAASALTSDHEAQLLNYLKATGKPIGYLVNSGCRESSHGNVLLALERLAPISEN